MNDTVAYVQGLTFALSPGASAASVLADESTDAGKVWATTLKTYLDLPHTGAVRWGLLPEEPHKTKLLIDWKTAEGHSEFESSGAAASLRSSWQSTFSEPIQGAIYDWGAFNRVQRNTALSSDYNTVSVLFTWRMLDPGAVSPAAAKRWRKLFDPFCREFMNSGDSPGAIYSYSINGWHLDGPSSASSSSAAAAAAAPAYSAVFHTAGTRQTQAWLARDDVRKRLEDMREPREDGTSGAEGPELEFMELKVYEEGWCGSVMRTKPEDPKQAAFIARMQEQVRQGRTERGAISFDIDPKAKGGL